MGLFVPIDTTERTDAQIDWRARSTRKCLCLFKGLQIENCIWRFGSRSRLIGTLIDVSISSTPLKASVSRNTPADDQEYLSDTPFLQPVTTAFD